MGAWVWAAACLCAVWCAGADRGGSSLRGALEALQRRQRGRTHFPLPQDYDSVYDFRPPQPYVETDYPIEVEDFEDAPSPKYIVKLLEENARNPESYEYKLINKKNSRLNLPQQGNKKESAFRERSHQPDSGSLRELFMDKNEAEEKNALREKAENDEEYALLLGELWSKYKSQKEHDTDENVGSQGIVKLYKDKIVKKRYSDNWGPIAFKKKRSSGPDLHSNSESDKNIRESQSQSSFSGYDLPDDDKDDLREEYAIAFQPLDDESLTELTPDDQYFYESVEKRFPISKRGAIAKNVQHKRFIDDHEKSDLTKQFRSSSGTDAKVLKDLAQIFGDAEIELKNPVKRSSDHEEHIHDLKPPMITESHNNTHEEHNSTKHDNAHHEGHGHLHHPGTTGKETDSMDGIHHDHSHHDHNHNEKPKVIRKKSIDWSDYFGIDKRRKKSVMFAREPTQERLRKQYFDTFSKEAIYPLNSFRQHSYVKKNYVEIKPDEDTDIEKHSETPYEEVNIEEKRSESDAKLDNIDKKLRNMEGLIVDEALHYTSTGEGLDSKEEQEMKEKLLSRLAAAYSLEKMRKALKDFKQSLQIDKNDAKSSPIPLDEAKAKRVAVKKEKVDIDNNEIPPLHKNHLGDDFEEELGAGHYLNGEVDQEFSEGYMGGSGRHQSPVLSTVGAPGSCPVLTKIVQRCRGVDLLAGDRGQLFLPLCSLHQICYLCGEAPPTTCDLVFLSEADTACEGDMACQRAARSALMALRELHDSQADELDGECEASPCLPATLKLNIGWQRALQ